MPKHRHILILARNAQEAVTYARRAGLPARTYRCVASASSIRGIQVADVHILPGFHRRPDSHAILAEFRWARDIRQFDVEMPAPLEAPPTDQGDGMGEQLDIIKELGGLLVEDDTPVVRDFVEAVIAGDASVPDEKLEIKEQNGSEAGTSEQVEDPTPVAPPRRRRSRCGECGELTFEAHDHAPKPLVEALDSARAGADLPGGFF